MGALMWRRVQSPAPGETYMHITQPLVAIVSRDQIAEDGSDVRWHLSVSHRDRVPTWGELGEARDALLPAELHFMLPHPPRRYWLNLNWRVLHLWEVRDAPLMAQFEWEGEAAQAAGYGTPDDGLPASAPAAGGA